MGDAEEKEFGRIGIGEESDPVYTIGYGSLAAVVSDAPLGSYPPTRENVLTHERVDQLVLQEHAVLPVAFGTIFRAPDDVLASLRSVDPVLGVVLETVRDWVEFGLKVLRERGGRTRPGAGPGGDPALAERVQALVAEIHEALGPVAAANRTHPPIGDRMVLDAAHLVERRAREREFGEVVKALGAAYEGLLRSHRTGLWPPYDFVDITLRLERTEGWAEAGRMARQGRPPGWSVSVWSRRRSSPIPRGGEWQPRGLRSRPACWTCWNRVLDKRVVVRWGSSWPARLAVVSAGTYLRQEEVAAAGDAWPGPVCRTGRRPARMRGRAVGSSGGGWKAEAGDRPEGRPPTPPRAVRCQRLA